MKIREDEFQSTISAFGGKLILRSSAIVDSYSVIQLRQKLMRYTYRGNFPNRNRQNSTLQDKLQSLSNN